VFRGAEALGDDVLRDGQWVRVFSRNGVRGGATEREAASMDLAAQRVR
jgi:hypothetical protein